MKNRISNIVWGLLLILVGVGYAGNTLGFWEFTLFFRGWWTLFIIIPCLISFIRRGANGGNVAGLLIGAEFLLSAWDVIDLSLLRRLLIPLILILIGVSILLSNTRTKRNIKDQNGNKIPYEKEGPEGSDVSGVFTGRRADYSGQVFEGATVNAVFGNVEMDLRMAVIERDIRIDATAVCGGIDILVPSNVMVRVMSVPVLGGVSNKAPAPTEIPCHTLYINATCVFGGVTVK